MKSSLSHSPSLTHFILTRLLNCAEAFKDQFRVFPVDTSNGETKDNPKRTAEVVADEILTWIEEHLQEDILHVKKSLIAPLFGDRITLRGTEADSVTAVFHQHGKFAPRAKVEANDQVVQAIPVVVVRNHSGEILRLKRRERIETKKLHEKLVLWAGGHVRKEDASNGDSIMHCAVREIQEELRLSIGPSELVFLGAVFADPGDTTSRHVAIVFEWRAATDDVAVTLSTSEFFERRGTSLSGRFVTLKELPRHQNLWVKFGSGSFPSVW